MNLSSKVILNNGVEMPWFGLGVFLSKDGEEVENAVKVALQNGYRHIDTAAIYKNERGVGNAVKASGIPRDEIFITSKVWNTDQGYKTTLDAFEKSLEKLQTDYLDLYQVHAISTPEDVDSRIQMGVLDVLLRAKQEGKIRYLGFTGHQNPFAHARMLERTKESDIFDTVLMPVNVLDQSYFSFTQNVMPKALDRNMGILAIKSLADGRFFAKKEQGGSWNTDDPLIPNYLSIKEAMHFVWSLPVSVLISGNENATFMREKIALARSFSKLTDEQVQALIDKVKHIALTGKVEYFKQKQV